MQIYENKLSDFLKNKEPSTINISSLARKLVFPYFEIYCASNLALETYGQTSSLPAAMLQNFDEFLKSENASNSQEIADAVLTLIETEKNEKPIRRAVGIDYKTNELTEKVEPNSGRISKRGITNRALNLKGVKYLKTCVFL